MLKTLAITALASVMISAFAQTTSTSTTMMTTSDMHPWRADKEYYDPSGKSLWDQKQHVMWAAKKCLFAGDQYTLENLFDRVPEPVEIALVEGLCNARQQAIMIDDRILAMRFPMDETTTTVSTTNPSGTLTTTKTTNDYAANIDWSSVDTGARPLRLVMTNPIRPKDINYDEAQDILCSRISNTERAILRNWWLNDASESEKDALVRFLKSDAALADDIYYPSEFVHRTYSWINQ